MKIAVLGSRCSGRTLYAQQLVRAMKIKKLIVVSTRLAEEEWNHFAEETKCTLEIRSISISMFFKECDKASLPDGVVFDLLPNAAILKDLKKFFSKHPTTSVIVIESIEFEHFIHNPSFWKLFQVIDVTRGKKKDF